MERTFLVTSTGILILSTAFTAAIDDIATNASTNAVAVDWTINQYLVMTANNAVGETTTNVLLFAKRTRI